VRVFEMTLQVRRTRVRAVTAWGQNCDFCASASSVQNRRPVCGFDLGSGLHGIDETATINT
jgi:hypothetical protein